MSVMPVTGNRKEDWAEGHPKGVRAQESSVLSLARAVPDANHWRQGAW